MKKYIVDVSQPPIPPPTYEITECGKETKESQNQTLLWQKYIKKYGNALQIKDKKKLD